MVEVECVLRVENINRFGVSVVCFVKRRQQERRVGFFFEIDIMGEREIRG